MTFQENSAAKPGFVGMTKPEQLGAVDYALLIGGYQGACDLHNYLEQNGYNTLWSYEIKNFYQPDNLWPRNLFTQFADLVFLNPYRPESTSRIENRLTRPKNELVERNDFGNGGRVLTTKNLIIADKVTNNPRAEQLLTDRGFQVRTLPLFEDPAEYLESRETTMEQRWAVKKVNARTGISGDIDMENALLENSTGELLLLTNDSYWQLYEDELRSLCDEFGINFFRVPESEENTGAVSIPTLPDGKVVVPEPNASTLGIVKEFMGNDNTLTFPWYKASGLGGHLRCRVNCLKY